MRDHLQRLVAGLDPLRGRNVAREYLQARILSSLQRAGAMTALAFQGGTCLRFLFGLPRYSEDLDFALERRPPGYGLRGSLSAAGAELAAEGYDVDVRVRDGRAVHSAVVRFAGVLHAVGLSPRSTQVLAIRIEVDANPPAGAGTDVTLVRRHETLRLFHHDRASLLAGKLHAVLERPYTKGRDLYDLVWYLADRGWPPPNLPLLNAALRQTGRTDAALTAETWRTAVAEKLEALDWDRAAADVRPFLERSDDAALVTKQNALRLLLARRGYSPPSLG
ncbi:MAG: nucleotidyl transferase AbiEii/AbiGii toxin family protein [Acidobacteria bacterium]|nr:nucleotidyl transferase AbiEii/AbiGii toxin family protein [Acidobacteriota bacterium]